MPRSLPVITGLPCNCGSRACSQEAKNASPSIWRTARGKECSVRGVSLFIAVFADHANDYGCNFEFLFGIEGFVSLVSGFQINFPAPLAKVFHRPGMIDLRDDNIAVVRLQA